MSNVLLVDDDKICLEMLGYLILETVGIHPCCATSGEEALQVMQKKYFDLIITDFNMPGINGIELAEQAQSIAPNTPVILNSGALSPAIIQRAKECGVFGVLEKPFNMAVMLSMINMALGTSQFTTAPTAPFSESGPVPTLI